MAFWDDAEITSQGLASGAGAGAAIGFAFGGGPAGAATGAKIGAALGTALGLSQSQRSAEAKRRREALEAERRRRAFEIQVSQYRGAIESKSDAVSDFIKQTKKSLDSRLDIKTDALRELSKTPITPVSGVVDITARNTARARRSSVLADLDSRTEREQREIADYGRLEQALISAQSQEQKNNRLDTSGLDRAKRLAKELGDRYGR